jgi:hypothetical protein
MDEFRAEAMRTALRRGLEIRFHTQIPADLAQAIDALSDLDEVTRWFEVSQAADSLEQFRAAVGH